MSEKVKVLLDNGKEVVGRYLCDVPDFNEPWEPEIGETYFSISNCLLGRKCNEWHRDSDSRHNIAAGICFKTANVAEFEQKRESLLRRMRNFARENGGPGAYTIRYDVRNGSMQYLFYAPVNIVGAVSFKDMKTVEEAIRRYGDEIKEICELVIKEETK